jgi:hypothetical protein
MNKNSIPAFIEDIAVDTENAKYSKAKLKIFYVGQTVDKRLFTKEFSDKLLSTIAYTPVVGFYSVADDDFVGHNNVQHIYGLVPESANIEYVEDAEQGVTFAVTDVILYTGREDEIGTIAAKIVGKQHSLELDPKTVAYKINYDEAGNFSNIEFTNGELVGLSVLGDNDRPAFAGSEFFSAQDLPDFITEENQGKYQTLFEVLTRIEPTAEEAKNEIYNVLESQQIYGYICEHKVDKYVVIETGYGKFTRYILNRDAENVLTATLDCSVRPRFVSDDEIGVLENIAKASGLNGTQQEGTTVDPEPSTTNNCSAASDGDEGNQSDFTANGTEELEALRSNLASLQEQFDTLKISADEQIIAFNNLLSQYKDYIINSYKDVLSSATIEEIAVEIANYSIEDLLGILNTKTEEAQAAAIIPVPVIEITNTSAYSEFCEEDVVKKYSKIKRGNN